MMMLLEDTRNPASKHRNVHAWAEAAGVTIKRTKLFVGDYTLPTDQTLCVDTKAHMQEVYQNLVEQHERFRNECKLAQEAGIRLTILVEDGSLHSLEDVASWINPRRERWYKIHAAHQKGRLLQLKIPSTPPVPSDRLMRMMATMTERYSVSWDFCSPSDTGARIWELLTPMF